jgi:hypothetical protein
VVREQDENRATMGVEYRHFLIPATCGLMPSAARVCKLVEKLVERRWLPDRTPEIEVSAAAPAPTWPMNEESFVSFVGTDFRLSWPLSWPGDLCYAFTTQAFADAYYTLEVYGSAHFLAPLSELVDPLQDPVSQEDSKADGLLDKVKGIFGSRPAQLLDLAIRCECGASLEDLVELFGGYTALLPRCPSCGKIFRPEERRGKLRNGWTGGIVERRPGGLFHRFALVVDCGKSVPNDNGPGVLDPSLTNLVSNCLGTTLFDFADLY